MKCQNNSVAHPMTSLSDPLELKDCTVQVSQRNIHTISNQADHAEIVLWCGTVIKTSERLNIMEKLWGDGESPR